MAATEDSDVPETGAVFTFGKSNFADNLPNKFWVKNDRVTHVACGDEHTALIVESGRVFMFGLNDWGQLGLGNDVRPGVNKPSCIKSLKQEKSKLVACGRSHTIISTESGHLYTFGSNSEGQLGILDVPDLYIPRCVESLAPTNYKMLTAGSDSSVALTDEGKVFVWGGNEDGKLGLGELVENAYEPELLEFDHKVVCVACGYYHTAVVTDDGKLYTMGEAEGGKLGLPDNTENTKVPQHVASIPDPVKWVACGSSHTVALTEYGECYVFGEGENGQLGLGTEVLSTSSPTHLPLPFKVSRVFCGQNFTALISEKGQLYTFGDGRHGKLAHGSDQFSNLYKPSHCKRFCHFTVDWASCGGCHMIVTARTKVNDGEVEDDEADEMRSLESKALSDSVSSLDGSPLTRTLSARERRRNELQKSFSNMSDLLPALTAYKKQSSLSATMPALKSSLPRINGDPLNKTMMPKLEAIPNGKGSRNGNPDEQATERGSDTEDKKMTSKVPPKISPRQKTLQSQDGSDGDDEGETDVDDEIESDGDDGSNGDDDVKFEDKHRKHILHEFKKDEVDKNDALERDLEHEVDNGQGETSVENVGEDKRPTEEHVGERSTEEHVGERSTEKHVGERSTEKHVGERSTEEHVGERPTEEHVGERSTEKHVGERPSEEHVGESPTEERVGERPTEEHVGENAKETTHMISDNEKESDMDIDSPSSQVPAVLPRRKKEQEDKQKATDAEEDSEKEDVDKKLEVEEKEKEHTIEQTNKTNAEDSIEKSTKDVKKKKKKDEEDDVEEDEENNNKAKGKKDKKKVEKEKKKKTGEDDEVKEDEKTDKKKAKTKKDKKKEKDFNDKKKKSNNGDDKDGERTDDKKDKEETDEHIKDKNDKDTKKDDLKSTEKDKSQANTTNPPKKSRLCTIL